MKNIFLLTLIFPIMAHATGITTIKGVFDKNEDSSISSKITVDVTKSGTLLDKKFYGSHLDSYSQMPDKSLVDELKLGKIRVGGNEYDVYNWQLNKSVNSQGAIINAPGIEAMNKSLKTYNVEGIYQINLTGFQPELVDGHYVVKRSFTAQSAYEMIKHLNGKLNLKLVDISLGNEFSIWNETHSKIWPTEDGISADEYIERYIQFALAIRRAQDEISGKPNDIKIWGPEISTSWYDWNTGNFHDDCQWTDVKGQVACTFGNGKFTHFLPYFFERLKNAENDLSINPKGYKLLDYLSIHYYPNFRSKSTDPSSVIVNEAGVQKVAEMLESTQVLNNPNFVNLYDISSYRNSAPNVLGRVKEWIKKGYPRAKLAINEFAVDSDYKSNHYHPIVRPLYLADSIGIFANEGVAFLNQFLLSSNIAAQLPWSMIESGERNNLFYMYKLFTNNFLGSMVETSDNMGDSVNSYARLQGDIINLAIINKEPVSRKVQIYVKGSSTKKLITFTVPGWSSSVIQFDKSPGLFNKNFQIQEFGAFEMGIPLEAKFLKKTLK